VASYWAGRFVKTLVFGVEPRDPATLAVAVLVLTAAALTAAWVPAHRACRANPTTLVRDS
jgi:ABC-type lipoprotein release transport system permease subunit